MTEIDDYNVELHQLVDSVSKEISSLEQSKIKGLDRTEQNKHVHSRINRAKQVLRAFKLELQTVEPESKQAYTQKWKEYSDTVNQLEQKANKEEERWELVEGNIQGNTDEGEMTTQAMVQKGARIQREDIDRLDNMIILIDEAKDVGAATQQKLVTQGEQLNVTKTGTAEISGYASFAKKMMSAFARKVMTDKIAMLLLVLTAIGIVIIILLKIFKV